MARSKSNPDDLARRQRAFELYCTIDSKGHRPTLRAIAHMLGMTVPAVKYWHTKDAWDERIRVQNRAISAAVIGQRQNVRTMLRFGVLQSIEYLRNVVIAPDAGESTDDRIKAAQALLKIAKENNLMDLSEQPEESHTELTFTDDLTGDPPSDSKTSLDSSSESLETQEPALGPSETPSSEAPLTSEPTLDQPILPSWPMPLDPRSTPPES